MIKLPQGKHILVFSSPNCGPCKRMAPLLEEVNSEVPITKVNVIENQKQSQEFAVTAVPTVLVMNGEEVVERIVGSQTLEQLQKITRA